MKTKMILLTLLLSMPLIIFSQDDFRKFGIGVGYSTSSTVGDSVKPFELSFRYRINNKHTIQLYAPLWLKKEKQDIVVWSDFVKEEHKKMYDHTFTHSLWGIGVGYDYSIYSFSYFDFFAGISADYQSYEYREDFFNVNYRSSAPIINRPPVYDDFQKTIETSYYWDRVKGVSIIPNTGIRLVSGKITTEAKLGLYFSRLNKKAYYLGKSKGLLDNEWRSTWESYYPDRNKKEFIIRPNILFNASYFF